MQALTQQQLLSAWESGMNESILQKSLHLLSWTYPELDTREIALWSIGQRDARLLELREALFGKSLDNQVNCPDCNETSEWTMLTKDLKVQPSHNNTPIKIDLVHHEEQLCFRLPNSEDILYLMAQNPAVSGTDELIKMCIIDSNLPAWKDDQIPDDLKDAIMSEMEKADPQANIELQLNCPECNHQWLVQFDIMSYLWGEINHWAYRIIQDVGLLAYHFGWSEKDILAMPPFRRELYLQMINE